MGEVVLQVKDINTHRVSKKAPSHFREGAFFTEWFENSLETEESLEFVWIPAADNGFFPADKPPAE